MTLTTATVLLTKLGRVKVLVGILPCPPAPNMAVPMKRVLPRAQLKRTSKHPKRKRAIDLFLSGSLLGKLIHHSFPII
jgi:hypothetical protein